MATAKQVPEKLTKTEAKQATAIAKAAGGSLHPNRGKVVDGVLRSRRTGSGLRRHLGDNITRTGTAPDELQKRIQALESSKKSEVKEMRRVRRRK